MQQQQTKRRRRSRRNRTPGWVILVSVNAVVIFTVMLVSLLVQISQWEKEADKGTNFDLPVMSASTVSEVIPQWEYSEPVVTQEVQETESPYPRFTYSKDWDGEDSYLLAKIAECEAGNQSVETRTMVILAVLNRVWSPSFPDSIEEVIMQERNGVYQFSPVMPDGSWWRLEPSEKSWEAVDLVMSMEYDTSQGCLYFESFSTEEEMLNSWHHKALEYLFQMEDMRFYK